MRSSKYPPSSSLGRMGLWSWVLAGLLWVVLGAQEARATQLAPRSEKKEKKGGSVSPTAAAPGSSPFTSSVFVQGNDWVGMRVQGYAVDDGGQYFNEDVLVIRGQTGLGDSPLPLGVKYDLAIDLDGDTAFFVNSAIVNEIFLSEQQGALTPALQAIAEPADPEPKGLTASKVFGRCSTRPFDRTKTFNLNAPIYDVSSSQAGFTGTLSVNVNVQGTGTGEVHLTLKRYALFGVCIPYGAVFKSARAYGTASVNYGATLSGTLSYAHSWEKEVAKPFLFSLNFAIGPVPVHIGFNLPITLGLDFEASVAGSVSYNGSQNAMGSFDYFCSLNGCNGTSYFAQSGPPSSQPFTGSVSGRLKPTLWAQAGVRAFLYDEWVAYMQLGVRPYLYGDLWGYYGNNCGDADQDGTYETVRALTFDLDWKLYITAQAAAFGGQPKKWDDLWHTNRSHIRFWDLIGSSALQPMFSGPEYVLANSLEQYSGKMRPCWPYEDNITYLLDWGDGSTLGFSASPLAWTGSLHSWPQPGVVGIGLTAQRDEHGRVLNASTPRTVTVGSPTGGGGGGGGGGTWTPWLNRDDPSATGDWETLSDFVNAGLVCPNPIAIACRATSTGADWSTTGEVYTCSLSTPIRGGICVNADQPDGQCLDYDVTFLCP